MSHTLRLTYAKTYILHTERWRKKKNGKSAGIERRELPTETEKERQRRDSGRDRDKEIVTEQR